MGDDEAPRVVAVVHGDRVPRDQAQARGAQLSQSDLLGLAVLGLRGGQVPEGAARQRGRKKSEVGRKMTEKSEIKEKE